MDTFQYDPALIDRYLDASEILEFGIDYYLYEDPKRTREEAATLAHAYTQKYCKRWCSRDRRDPVTRHTRAFDSFVEKVQYGQYFNSPRRQKAAEAEEEARRDAQSREARQQREKEEKAKAEKLKLQQQENERRRVAALRERCIAQGLDFEKENIRQLRRRRTRERFFSILMVLVGIPCALCLLLIILWAVLFGWAGGTTSPFDGYIAILSIIWLVTGGLGCLLMLSERKNLPKEAYAPLEEHKKAKKKVHK